MLCLENFEISALTVCLTGTDVSLPVRVDMTVSPLVHSCPLAGNAHCYPFPKFLTLFATVENLSSPEVHIELSSTAGLKPHVMDVVLR